MSRHLPLLVAKFPGKMMLNVDDIASLMEYSKGHIYNLASAKKLPFKLAVGLGDKILVSVIEMADYLDSTLLSHTQEKTAPQTVEIKKKVGRPRGTTKANLEVRCFQGELRTAIYEHEVQGILKGLRHSAEGMVLVHDDSRPCGDRFEQAKTSLIHDVGSAEAHFEKIYFELVTGIAARKSRHNP